MKQTSSKTTCIICNNEERRVLTSDEFSSLKTTLSCENQKWQVNANNLKKYAITKLWTIHLLYKLNLHKYARYYGIPVSAFLHNYTYRVVDKKKKLLLSMVLNFSGSSCIPCYQLCEWSNLKQHRRRVRDIGGLIEKKLQLRKISLPRLRSKTIFLYQNKFLTKTIIHKKLFVN